MGVDKDIVGKLVREYLNSREMVDKVQKRVDEFKRELTRLTKEHGTPDDRGSKWLPAGDHQVKYERRVSKSFNLHAAQEWAKENGYWDQVKEIVEVASEDNFLRLSWDTPELEPIISSFYSEKEVWAFKVVEQRSYDDE